MQTWRRPDSSIKIAGPDNVAAAAFNFGRVRVPHWEYDHSFPFPSVLRIKSSYTDELPQSFAKGYLGYLALHNAGVLLESVALRARAMLGGGSSPSLTKIQGKFARTLSEELSADKRNSDAALLLLYRTPEVNPADDWCRNGKEREQHERFGGQLGPSTKVKPHMAPESIRRYCQALSFPLTFSQPPTTANVRIPSLGFGRSAHKPDEFCLS